MDVASHKKPWQFSRIKRVTEVDETTVWAQFQEYSLQNISLHLINFMQYIMTTLCKDQCIDGIVTTEFYELLLYSPTSVLITCMSTALEELFSRAPMAFLYCSRAPSSVCDMNLAGCDQYRCSLAQDILDEARRLSNGLSELCHLTVATMSNQHFHQHAPDLLVTQLLPYFLISLL